MIAAVIRDAMRHNLTHSVQQFRTLSVQVLVVALLLSSASARASDTGCAVSMNEQNIQQRHRLKAVFFRAVVRDLPCTTWMVPSLSPPIVWPERGETPVGVPHRLVGRIVRFCAGGANRAGVRLHDGCGLLRRIGSRLAY